MHTFEVMKIETAPVFIFQKAMVGTYTKKNNLNLVVE